MHIMNSRISFVIMFGWKSVNGILSFFYFLVMLNHAEFAIKNS